MNVTEFLNKNANRFPQKAAVGFKKDHEWKELSWYKLRQIVFKTANALRNAGIVSDDRVAIYSDNTAEWMIMDLAVMSLGAITVPIYSTNGADSVEYIIKDSEPRIILAGNQDQYNVCLDILRTNSSSIEKIIVTKEYIKLQENTELLKSFIDDASQEFEIVQKDENDTTTLIYTSGTTGIPKGVMLTHANFVKAFDAHMDFFKFKNFEKEHSLAFLPLTHVFERSWSLLCLYFGAKVSFLENTKDIVNALTEVKPTLMCSVPRFYQKIYGGLHEMVANGPESKKKIFNWAIETGGQVAERKRNNQSVPFVLGLKYKIANKLVFGKVKTKLGGKLWFMPCGGASLSDNVTKFFDAMGIHLSIGYGMTETTATVTAFPFTHYRYDSAGQLMGDTQVKIGENDEILAKGSGIMKGYYKKPEDTAAAFTEDGWFKTGDAGYLDEKGNLVITDRIKDLMKTSNGKYIAPQPIENLFSNNTFVNQILLIAEGKSYPTALVVPNFEVLPEKLKSLGVEFTNWNDVVKNEKVIAFYKGLIDDIQKNLSGFEKIKKFTLMPSEFEISTGELTPSLKIKRNIVLKKYADLVDSMYN